MIPHSSPLVGLRRPITDAFATTQGLRDLPQSLVDLIERLLEKHPVIEESHSQLLHDDLLKVYRGRVVQDETKLAGFLHALQLLRPWLTRKDRKLYWWETAIFPVLNNVGRLRVEIERASDFMVAILAYDANESDDGIKAKESRLFLDLVLDGYFNRTKWSSVEGGDYTWENEHCAAQFEQILVTFAKRRPKAMMLALDPMVLNPKHRAQALGLLAIVIQHQPAHIHSVVDTPIIEHLLQCLTIDASTVTVQFAVTALVMFLPHIPSAVRKYLPRLFLIYGRLACWDQVKKTLVSETDSEDNANLERDSPQQSESVVNSVENLKDGWQKMYCTADGEDTIPLDVSHLFTFLYGLYPLNFLSFVRKPRAYLENASFEMTADFELNEDLIRERTTPLRDMHRLHPNLYQFTIEEELQTDRWLSSESSEIVGECIGLVIDKPKVYDEPGPPPTGKLPPIPQARRGSEADASTRSLTHENDAACVAPRRESPQLTSSQRRPPEGSLGARDRSTGPREALSRGRSPSQVSSARRAASRGTKIESPLLTATGTAESSVVVTSNTRSLDRLDLMKVLNELRYERFLRQQQSAHVGHLQRRHISDATLIANYENITSLNKTLTSRLTRTTEAFSALKKDVAAKRQQSRTFELELSTKVRTYRAMERDWTRSYEELKADHDRLFRDCEALKKLVVVSESNELQSGQTVDAMKFDLKRAQKAQEQNKEFEEEIKKLKHENWEHENTIARDKTLRHEMEVTRLQLEATRSDYKHMLEDYEKAVTDLTLRVRENEFWEDKPQVKSLIERFNQQKETLTQLRSDYKALRHENIELEIRLQDYEENDNRADVVETLARSKSRPKDAALSTQRDNAEDDVYYKPGQAPASYAVRRPSRPPHNHDTASARSSAAAPGGSEGIILGGASSAPTKPAPTFSSNSFDPTANRSGSNIHGETGIASGFDSDNGGSNAFYRNKASAFSADSLDSAQTGGSGKTKISTKSDNRIFGRGGSQNIGKTEGEVAEEKKKFKKKAPPKTGGIRGIRGLM